MFPRCPQLIGIDYRSDLADGDGSVSFHEAPMGTVFLLHYNVFRLLRDQTGESELLY